MACTGSPITAYQHADDVGFRISSHYSLACRLYQLSSCFDNVCRRTRIRLLSDKLRRYCYTVFFGMRYQKSGDPDKTAFAGPVLVIIQQEEVNMKPDLH